MRLLNWNIDWWVSPESDGADKVLEPLAGLNPEVICLTEVEHTFPELLLNKLGGYLIYAPKRAWRKPAEGKPTEGHKVLLWSKKPWRNKDQSAINEPPDRFICGTTESSPGKDLAVVGVCIPYMQSRCHSGYGYGDDHFEYLQRLNQVLQRLTATSRDIVLIGDFNQRIGVKKQPGLRMDCREMLGKILASWEKPTAFPGFYLEDHSGDKHPSIDHICLREAGVIAGSPRSIDEDHANRCAKDSEGHFGAVVDLQARS